MIELLLLQADDLWLGLFQYIHSCEEGCMKLLMNIKYQILKFYWLSYFIIVQELNVPEGDVEQLLVSLILDNRIQGHIDQVNKLLERGDRSAFFFKLYVIFLFIILILTIISTTSRSKGMKKYAAIEKWNMQLRSLYQTVSSRVTWDWL